MSLPETAYDPYAPRSSSKAKRGRPVKAAPPANSELSPGELKALKFHHYGAIAAQQAKVAAQNAEYKRLRKLAKADGIVLSDIDFMMKCAEVEDADILTGKAKREAEIMAWFALPVQFQPDMFGGDSREPGEDRAVREGEAAGFAGKDPSAPYDAASVQGQAWLRGWHKAQEQMRADLASAMEKRNSAKGGDELIQAGEDDDPFAEKEAA